MAAISSVMTFGMNQILIGFTTTATAVLGVYFKLQSFIFMPVFGLNNGMVPIVAYNFGARKPDRMMRAMKLGVLYATAIMALGSAIRFLLAGFCIISSSFFQALGHGVLSLIISLVRQLVVLLPVAWLLSLSGQLALVWWAFPFAELFSLTLCIFFHRYVYRREIRPLMGK